MTIKPINVDLIASLHQECITTWEHKKEITVHDPLLQIILQNHRCNFDLWQTEDEARRDDKGPTLVYEAKRKIDKFNQQRNDKVEAIDQLLVEMYQPSSDINCPIHSETPGMMIDRLSILSLKQFYMHKQTHRTDVKPEHREQCQAKYAILQQQHAQLLRCLDELLTEVDAKKRTFRVYYQMKMYNNPELNPHLHRK